jgi:hypothetical protein
MPRDAPAPGDARVLPWNVVRSHLCEFKTRGPVYRRTVETTLKASYTNHYRRGADQ